MNTTWRYILKPVIVDLFFNESCFGSSPVDRHGVLWLWYFCKTSHCWCAALTLVHVLGIAHVQYIKILTWLRGFRVKIVRFSRLHALSRNSQKRPEHEENQTEYRKMNRKPRSHVRILPVILIYRTWAIKLFLLKLCERKNALLFCRIYPCYLFV